MYGMWTDHLIALGLDLLLLILRPLKGVLAEEHHKQHHSARPHVHRLPIIVACVALRDDLRRCKKSQAHPQDMAAALARLNTCWHHKCALLPLMQLQQHWQHRPKSVRNTSAV